jgi:hypothetical protein
MQNAPQNAAPSASNAIESNPFDTGAAVVPPKEKLWSYDFIDRLVYAKKFSALSPNDGKLSGAACKPVLESFGLEQTFLSKIWHIADWSKDGNFV